MQKQVLKAKAGGGLHSRSWEPLEAWRRGIQGQVFISVPQGRVGGLTGWEGASAGEQADDGGQAGAGLALVQHPMSCLLTAQAVGVVLFRAFRRASTQPSESSTTGWGCLRKSPSLSCPTQAASNAGSPCYPSQPYGGPRWTCVTGQRQIM